MIEITLSKKDAELVAELLRQEAATQVTLYTIATPEYKRLHRIADKIDTTSPSRAKEKHGS